MTNAQIEAARNHITKTEKTAGVTWSRAQAIEVLTELWWIRTEAKARQVLTNIDSFGFDNWEPRK